MPVGDETIHTAGRPWMLWTAVGVLIIAVAVAWTFLPVKEWMESFQRWIQDLGVAGYVLFAGAYIVGTVLLAPAAPLSVAAGVAFHGWGIPLVLASATVGATLAFLVARYVARDRIKSLLESRPKFHAVDQAVCEEGWKVVLLLRLSPLVPFNVQNYIFGVTDVSLKHYAAATLVGIVPGTVLAVYLGMIGSGAGGSDPWTWGLFGIGLIASVIAIVLVSRKARAKLKEMGMEGKAKR